MSDEFSKPTDFILNSEKYDPNKEKKKTTYMLLTYLLQKGTINDQMTIKETMDLLLKEFE